MKLSLVLAILSKLPANKDDALDVQTLCRLMGDAVSIRTMQRCMEYLSAGDASQGLPALVQRIDPTPTKTKGTRKSDATASGRAYRYCLESSALRSWFITDQVALNLSLADQAVGRTLGSSQRIAATKLASQASLIVRNKSQESHRLLSFVRVVPDGIGRKPAEIPTEVRESVLDAIARGRLLEFTYRSRRGEDRDWIMSPRGLVAKDGTLYLIGTKGLSSQPVTFALHRMTIASVSSQSIPPMDFDLDRYLEYTQNLSHPIDGSEPVLLRLRVEESTLYHFEERPLWEQKVEASGTPGHVIITARVPDSVMLVPFLLSMSPGVEVLEPKDVRAKVAQRIFESARQYQ